MAGEFALFFSGGSHCGKVNGEGLTVKGEGVPVNVVVGQVMALFLRRLLCLR